jgi:hypothetical protein
MSYNRLRLQLRLGAWDAPVAPLILSAEDITFNEGNDTFSFQLQADVASYWIIEGADADKVNLSVDTLTPDADLAPGVYTFIVTAVSVADNAPSVPKTMTMTVVAVPALTTPVISLNGTASVTDFVVNVSSVVGAVSRNVRLNGVVSTGYGVGPTITISGLSPLTPYDVEVQAVGVSALSAWSTLLTVTTAPGPVPAISVAPVLSGTATVGSTLSLSTGSWAGGPSVYERRWLRAYYDGSASVYVDAFGQPYGTQVAGDVSTRALISGDLGEKIFGEVRAYNSSGWSDWVPSNITSGVT